MALPIEFILAAAPQDTRAAQALCRRVAHMAYRVGPGLALLRDSIGTSMRGGFMTLSDEAYDGSPGSASGLCREVLRECELRGYEGVVADFEQSKTSFLKPFVEQSASALKERGLTLYVSPQYANASEHSRVLISTAIVSGSLRERLTRALDRFGPRLAIEIERTARDIPLPDPQGEGHRLAWDQMKLLVEGRQAFFSRELCSRYFTYKDKESGQTHFVLFDDAQSIQKKVLTAASMGINEAFMLYPEVAEIWKELTKGF